MAMSTRCFLTVAFVLLVSTTVTVPGMAGTLQFYVNGEEFATEGFLSPATTKDGWNLRFRHIYVGLADVTAYQTAPPYDAVKGGEIDARTRAGLPGHYLIDLVADTKKSSRILVGDTVAPIGHYNALSWKMIRADSGAATGYSMMLIGTAEKEGTTVDFELMSKEEATYRCGEYIGDERKGFLNINGTSDQEITFHLDHIFGRADKSATDAMNLGAAGFAPFANGGRHSVKLKGMHIGHVGEGHCAVEWH